MDDSYKIHDRPKLDRILVKLCELVLSGQRANPESYGMVAACIIDTDNRMISRLNYKASNGKRIHAERAAIAAYNTRHGDIPVGSIIVTTLSPCCDPMTDRFGDSCSNLINRSNVHKVYAGYMDPTQSECHNDFTLEETRNHAIRRLCKKIAGQFL